MRATAVRRSAIAASVVSLALLVTACGGSDAKDEKDSAAPSAKDGGATKAAVKALTQAEIEKASLEQGDVAGHKITKTGAEDVVKSGDVTVDKKECEPLGFAYSGMKRGTPVGTAGRQVVQEPEKDATADPEDAMQAAFDVTSTLVTLASYEGDAAAKSIAELRDSAAKCAGGFTMTIKGDKTEVVKLTEEKVTGGDEALAWTVGTRQEGTTVPTKLVSLRQGGTVATFLAFNLGVVASGKADFELPSDVVAAQVEKLG
ncbi:hypothetical protein [Streptomyces sp. B1I3]|uniref:hypothetical protein n=1 Tax=Streptomyces sp. B1I3 TaxID=3042264 RepID=UPI00277FBD9B|nr:hypothetical protein [Streptomyces sp. B1I3]MDQ0794877.1 hypothetical protein [Streptomyces sp. B1I3]